MNTCLKYIYALLVSCVSFSQASQINLESYSRSFDSIPIAIIAFEATSYRHLKIDQPWRIIGDDLDFCGRFAVLQNDTKDSLLFSAYNIGLFIDGEYTLSDDSITMVGNLRDVFTNEILYTHTLKSTLRSMRKMAHIFSNKVYELLFEEQGPFESRMLFVRDNGQTKNIFIMDFDGRNINQYTHTKSINIFPCFLDSATIVWVSYLNGKPDLFKGNLYNKKYDSFIYSRATETSPSVSLIENKIVYASSRAGDLDIYVSDFNGKNTKRITFTKAIDTSPCWAPQGYQIAFISDRAGQPQVYIMDTEGSNVRRLTYVGNYQDSPAWSPRGDKIAYTSLSKGKYDIWVINIDGTDPKQLTTIPGNNEYPTWSPDGSNIAFQSRQPGRSDIYSIRLDGTGLKRLTTSGTAKMPDWSQF